jgi:hypothetical protein
MEEGKSGDCDLYWLARFRKATVAGNATVISASAPISKPAPQELFGPKPNLCIENISPVF